jgi:hypothetical protein
VGICGYDSTSYELLEGSTSECALHAITSCPTADTESSFPAPVDRKPISALVIDTAFFIPFTDRFSYQVFNPFRTRLRSLS